MSRLNVLEYVDCVKKSGLVDVSRLDAALSRLDVSASDSAIVGTHLVDEGLITDWQNVNLMAGRHRGFFLGKYKVLEQLGAGGMGSVFRAEHVLMGHQVAIKVLSRRRLSQPTAVERFYREARAVARLNHPNVVRAFDVGQETDTHYLVMEYVPGITIQNLVKDHGPLDLYHAADYARQAAQGLDHAHRANLIHRDVKPANLLLDPAGVVKVLDLGLALARDTSVSSLTIEHDEKVMGTVDYLPPEQAINSHAVDARGDIYALGCTLYYMLAGRAPFPSGTLTERLLSHQSAPPPDIRAFRSDLPARLWAICQKMLAKLPQQRFQSSQEVVDALGEWLAVEGTQLPRVPDPRLRPASSPKADGGPGSGGQGSGSSVLGLARPDIPMPGESRIGMSQHSGTRTPLRPSSDSVVFRSSDTPGPGSASSLTSTSIRPSLAELGQAPIGGDAASSSLTDASRAAARGVAPECISPTAMSPQIGAGQAAADGPLLDIGDLVETVPTAPEVRRNVGQPTPSAPPPTPPPAPPEAKTTKKTKASRKSTKPKRSHSTRGESSSGWSYSWWFLVAAGVLIGVVLILVAFSAIGSFKPDEPDPTVETRQSD